MINVTVIIPTKDTIPKINPIGKVKYLIIDDGSEKAVADELENACGNNEYVRIIHQKNKGVGASRNSGIKQADTKYIYFLDADDEFVGEDIVVELANIAETKGVKVAGGSMVEIRPDGTEFCDWQDHNRGFVFEREGYIKYTDYQFDYGFYRFVYDRQFLVDNKIFFPKLKRFQDPPFFVKALYTAQKFYAVPTVTYKYRVGTTSWTKDKVRDCAKGIFRVACFSKRYQLIKLMSITRIRLSSDFNEVINQYKFVPTLFLIKLMMKITSVTSYLHFEK